MAGKVKIQKLKTKKHMKEDKKITGYRPTQVEINLANLAFNFKQVRKLAGKNVKILAAVKANAYGHGIVEVAQKLEKCGADYLGVACVGEAALLRDAAIKLPILIIGLLSSSAEIKRALKLRVSITVADYPGAKMISRCASGGEKATVHIKVDTGMGRLGVWHEQAAEEIPKIAGLKNLFIEGIYTHFPSSDTDKKYTQKQMDVFKELLIRLKTKGIDIPLAHAANSSAVCNIKSSYLNMVRPGIMLYGIYPNECFRKAVNLRPLLTFKTKIIYLKTVEPGRSISYGRTYIAKRRTKIATIPVGYADGYTRALSNKAKVLVRGRFASVVGRICMDQTMIDVGGVPGVKVGDPVILIGKDDNKRIRAEELANLCKTIAYEITCGIPTRVRRVFKNY
ncbi:MAG: alanine racemase [Candidatus Omnitrophota bacterium]